MKSGDIVKCNDWVHGGHYGLVVQVQEIDYCRGAYILFSTGVALIRIENLEVISEV